ncbi:isocitrate/isopropylmalate dehydrogenase family protein [Falsiroseomonas sp. CW058]|uniref:isocitrate/isopropylmalate dehydrogenase family protein n=1 Tax=Falsiroseomonas sp. CW058 TaxID=3388664 RepID=UPI003D31E921
MQLIVLPGDGIGPEITEATVAVLEAAAQAFQLRLDLQHDVVGLESHRRHGTTVQPALLDRVRAADGLILGPTSTLEYRPGDPGQVGPSKFFRKGLDLFANIRPARTYPGMPARLGQFDLVVVRENTEGFYADRNMEQGNAEILVTPDVVVSMRRITRHCCLRIARAAFELAQRRRKKVTAVHKANVLSVGDGMFLDCCREVARDFPEVTLDEVIVDAMMAHVVRNPARFDVIVTTNMFGDILSDLTAEMSGSLGLGGSLNAGADSAMAQAAHGSAPDIAGQGIANPVSLILSTALLLSWHGRRKGEPRFAEAGAAIEEAVAAAIGAGESTRDLGGGLGTRDAGAAVAARLKRG